jgi:hypothetical protein
MFPTQLPVQVLVRHGRQLSCATRSPPARRCRAPLRLAIADFRSSRSPPPSHASPRSLPPSLVAPVLQKVGPRSNSGVQSGVGEVGSGGCEAGRAGSISAPTPDKVLPSTRTRRQGNSTPLAGGDHQRRMGRSTSDFPWSWWTSTAAPRS